MKKPKVFIAYDIFEDSEKYIGEYCDYTKLDSSKKRSFEDLKEGIKEADGIVVMGTRIDDELLQYADNLKVVSNVSVGYNNLDIEAMKKRGIVGTNTPGVLDDTVADTIFGLILNIARKFPKLEAYAKAGKWKKGDSEEFYGKDVHHSTLGIIGFGRIGETVAKRAKGFDMDIIYHNRNRKPKAEEKYGAKYVEMEELLKTADFVVVMTPLNDETHHLMGEDEFKLMKKEAFLINASRGPVVDEKALIKALEEGEIAGAGLDVYEQEPIDPNNPLLKMDNTVTLPHVGSSTLKTRQEMAMLAAKTIVDVLYGRPTDCIVPELR
ncbi:MAG: D-glycerate dehydrogenase [Gudongella sp.]|nr:D-glycerate dehydrogenase [Gudongella sp.]